MYFGALNALRMKNSIRIVILVFACFSFYLVHAQHSKESYNSLLWRITGKGLSKPSYLFGTMHIADRRAFMFTDSLYKALENTDAFAAELDLVNMMNRLFRDMMESKEQRSNILITDVVEKSVLEKYKAGLEKKLKKPVGEISLSEVESASSFLFMDILKQGDMPTILDMYLYDMARKHGKILGGIEDYEDQISSKGSDDLEEKIQSILTERSALDETFEKMIKTYVSENLGTINRDDELWAGAIDEILLRRNVKMSYRIDSLSHVRSYFFAVGAAHIPGDSGVVNLLRNRGFTVTPVQSARKIKPEDYKGPKVKESWITTSFAHDAYSLELPSNAQSIDAFGNSTLDMGFYLDLGLLRGYITMNIDIELKDEDKGQMMKQIVENYREEASSFSENDVKVADLTGKEIRFTNNLGSYRMNIFWLPSGAIINFVFSMKEQSLTDASTTRFLQSFKTLKKKVRAVTGTGAGGSATNWEVFLFPENAFSVEMPAKFESMGRDTIEGWIQQRFQASALSEQIYIGLLTANTSIGYYNNADSAYFETLKASLIENLAAEELEGNHTTKDGYPGYEGKLLTRKEGEFITNYLFLHRGNRRYVFYTTQNKEFEKNGASKRFFSSIKLLPYKSQDWGEKSNASGDFSVWTPGRFTEEFDTANNILRFLAYDSLTPGTLYIQKHIFHPNYWAPNDSTLFEATIASYSEDIDTIFYKKKVNNGNVEGVEILGQSMGSHNFQRIRLLLNADTLYSIFTYMPASVIETGDYNRAFESFRFKKEEQSINLFTNKAAAVMNDLLHGDSSNFATAREFLEALWFSESDLPVLHKALLHPYRDFSSTEFCTHDILINTLVPIANHSTVQFVKDNYKSLTGEKEELKYPMLRLLGRLYTKEAYAVLKEFLTKNTPIQGSATGMGTIISDSLRLALTLYPEILTLIKDKLFASEVVEITASLMDSNLISVKTILPYKKDLLNYARKVMISARAEDYTNGWTDRSLLTLLAGFNDAETNAALQQFSKVPDLNLKEYALLKLIANNQPANSIELEKIGADIDWRTDLYEELKKLNKLKFFPQKYATQKLFAASYIYHLATEDDENAEVTVIGERIETYMGKKQRFFLGKVTYTSDEDGSTASYLAIVGPFSLDGKQISSELDILEFAGDYDAATLDEQFRKFVNLRFQQ
jgi:uncharacterized protein YbaP (TraB family)